MAVKLVCPECRGKFRWDFSEKEKWPKHCPLCDTAMGGDRDDDVICMPSLRGAKTDAVDATYRSIEKTSEVRMHQAAEAAGAPVSEMTGLKVTDLRSGVKPGESYMPEVRNVVTQQMEAIQARGGQAGFTGANGAEFAAGVKTGLHPNAGAKTLAGIQRLTGRA